MKTHLPLKILSVSLLAVATAIVLWACQKEKYPDDMIDTQIASSAEMENYIVAGYELQAALNEFQKAMNAIDWSQMHYVKDEDGHEVMHLPVQSLIFEAKLNQFNDKKDILQRKYRRLTSYSQEKCEDIIQYCLKNSVMVSTKLLDMGIDIYLPTTKFMDDPEGLNQTALMDSLGRYTADTSHVEAMFFGHDNGYYDIHIDSANTRYEANPPGIVTNGGKYYWRGGSYPNSPINTIGHTHFGNDSIPSHTDSIATRLPGIRYVIFQGGTFHDF